MWQHKLCIGEQKLGEWPDALWSLDSLGLNRDIEFAASVCLSLILNL